MSGVLNKKWTVYRDPILPPTNRVLMGNSMMATKDDITAPEWCPRIGDYVRLDDGRVARVLGLWPYKAHVQTHLFEKNRHKHRITVEIRDLTPLSDLEVLAEAGCGSE